MTYSVYADLCRRLTAEERSTLFEALDALVPGSGCIGPQRLPNDEVYFTVEAASEDDARRQAQDYMVAMLKSATLDVDYTIECSRHSGGSA
jgi:hypothetical protein